MLLLLCSRLPHDINVIGRVLVRYPLRQGAMTIVLYFLWICLYNNGKLLVEGELFGFQGQVVFLDKPCWVEVVRLFLITLGVCNGIKDGRTCT
jgi:hypothetical protein